MALRRTDKADSPQPSSMLPTRGSPHRQLPLAAASEPGSYRVGPSAKSRLERLYDRLELLPSDYRVSIQLFSELYSLGDFAAAEEVLRPIVATKRVPGTLSYQYGKCLFKVWWNRKKESKYLSAAIASFREAMSERDISRQPLVYLELATFYMCSGLYQDAIKVLSLVSFMFQDVAELVLLSQYCVVMITCLSGNITGGNQLLMELALFAFSADLGLMNTDVVVLLPYRVYEPFLAFEQAALLHRQGQILQASHLMAEVFTQMRGKHDVNAPPDVALVLNTIYTAENFMSWDIRPENHCILADYFLGNRNYFMAAEYRVRAAERTLVSGESKDWQARVRAGELCAAAARIVLEAGGTTIAVMFAKKAAEKSHFDYGCLNKTVSMLCPGNPENYRIFASYIAQRHVYLTSRGGLIRWLRSVREKIDTKRFRAAVKLNSFMRMILTRNRTAGERFSEVSVLGRERLLQSIRGRLLKSGTAQLQMWEDIWGAAATNIQNVIRCWYCKRRYRMSRSGLSTFQALYRGARCRSRLRALVQILAEELSSSEITAMRKSQLLLAMKQPSSPFLVDIFESRSICSGVTCHLRYDAYEMSTTGTEAADEYSMYVSDSVLSSSVIWNRSRLERRFMTEHRSVVLPRTIRSRLRETQMHAALLSAELTHGGSAGSVLPGGFKAQVPSLDGGPTSSDLDRDAPISAGVSDNAILTIISFVSLGNDASKQWMPLTMMPDREVERILRVSTHLIISSALFSHYDARRLFWKLRRNPEWWWKVQSLVVQGCGPRDHCINALIAFGVRHMQSVTLSSTGVTVRSAKLLGLQLSARSPDITKSVLSAAPRAPSSASPTAVAGSGTGTAVAGASRASSVRASSAPTPPHPLPWVVPVPRDLLHTVLHPGISKICIEHERHFGDKAVAELAKHVQHCKSMRHLSVVDCGITDMGARSLERLILLNNGIEVIRLDGNHISRSCVELMVKACALHGVRSSFRQLCVRLQRPALSAPDLEAISLVAQKVGVKCHLSEPLRDEVDELRSSFLAMRNHENDCPQSPPSLNRSANASIIGDDAVGSLSSDTPVATAENPAGSIDRAMPVGFVSSSSLVSEGLDDDDRELADLRTRLEAKFAESRRGGKVGSLYKHVYL